VPDIFKKDIAGKIGTKLAPLVFDVTLVVVTPGTRTVGQLTAGTQATETSYTVKGWVDEMRQRYAGATQGATIEERSIVERQDKLITLLGSTLPSGVVPKPNDRLTAEGVTRRIVDVDRDPAGAVYECQAR